MAVIASVIRPGRNDNTPGKRDGKQRSNDELHDLTPEMERESVRFLYIVAPVGSPSRVCKPCKRRLPNRECVALCYVTRGVCGRNIACPGMPQVNNDGHFQASPRLARGLHSHVRRPFNCPEECDFEYAPPPVSDAGGGLFRHASDPPYRESPIPDRDHFLRRYRAGEN